MGKLSVRFLFATYGERIVEQLSSEPGFNNEQIFPRETIGKIVEYGLSRGDSSVNHVKSNYIYPIMRSFVDYLCPFYKTHTPELKWVFKQYLSHRHNDKPILTEDLYKMNEVLANFRKLHKTPAFKDSGAKTKLIEYDSYSELLDVIKPISQSSELKKMSDEEKSRADLEETTILYEGPEGKVVVPHTPLSSRFWGSSEWCISRKNSAETRYEDYSSWHPIIMLIPKFNEDNKVAIAGFKIWDSNDNLIDELPKFHQNLFDKTYNNLSVNSRGQIDYIMSNIDENIEVIAEKRRVARVEASAKLKADYDKEVRIMPKGWEEAIEDISSTLLFFGIDDDYIREDCKKYSELLADKRFLIEASKRCGEILKVAPKEYANDRELVCEMIKNSSFVFETISDELKNDKELVKDAIRKSFTSFSRASEELRADREFAKEALAIDGQVLTCLIDRYAPNINIDKELVTIASENSAEITFDGMGFDLSAYLSAEKIKDLQVHHLNKFRCSGDSENFFMYVKQVEAGWGDKEIPFNNDMNIMMDRINNSYNQAINPTLKKANMLVCN